MFYRMERLEVHGRICSGCSSADFLQLGESILTLAEPLTFYAERDRSYIFDRVLCCVQTQYRKLKK